MTTQDSPPPGEWVLGDHFDSIELKNPVRAPEHLPPDRFEIGLVLAGAVAAGAYVAGAMDFLFEALDNWQVAKEQNAPGTIPDHHVLIRVITGTSGGGMNGGIAASVVGQKFPHVRLGNTGTETGNPFFDVWVNEIDISNLLSLNDLIGETPEILSLLDSTQLDAVARRALTSPPGQDPKRRDYFANPLRLFLTTTNLRGVPYWMSFKGNTDQGHGMQMHRDHLRFALQHQGNIAAETPFPDEIVLKSPADVTAESWERLATASLATGAFPMFLKAQEIVRNFSDYDHRAVFANLGNKPGKKYTVVKPNNAQEPDSSFEFLAVDGGTMNNEPIELARQVLAGAFGRNPRDGQEANRATVMIDPFPEAPTPGPRNREGSNPFASMIALLNAWKSESRFRAQDLALSVAGDSYSRFLIAPSRGNADRVSRGYRLTSEAFGGFGGFLSRHYRVHDFLLGRRNCQRFLSQHFVLPKDNQLFDKWARGSNSLLQKYLVKGPSGTKDHLPIIPLIKGTSTSINEETMPSWPSGLYERTSIEPLLEGRFNALYDASLSKLELGWLEKLYLKPIKSSARNKLLKAARENLAKTLGSMNL